eukprot:CAMPEP_0174253366 /NCGR_PEP_ID=MMETSP0439-20130205/2739_1 /TAXON_ID=0 /ORGANISM="Stereomyxa ramosa, Strain Chinc5" /LENGTH=289 /DNA_ID=CAMNT_0015334353 /DNA_START=30 /DNA_END=897 /DNA_ORIENTATION=-
MGRRPIKIAFIEKERTRQATFKKRKLGLIKKAMELSILCGCDVGLIVIETAKKKRGLTHYSNKDLTELVDQYKEGAFDTPLPLQLKNEDYSELFLNKDGGRPPLKRAKKATSRKSSCGGGGVYHPKPNNNFLINPSLPSSHNFPSYTTSPSLLPNFLANPPCFTYNPEAVRCVSQPPKCLGNNQVAVLSNKNVGVGETLSPIICGTDNNKKRERACTSGAMVKGGALGKKESGYVVQVGKRPRAAQNRTYSKKLNKKKLSEVYQQQRVIGVEEVKRRKEEGVQKDLVVW